MITLPFNLAKTADGIKSISKFSFVIIVYILLVLIFQTPDYVKEVKPNYSMFKYDLKKWGKSYGNFIYSFNCIVNVFLVKTNLHNPNRKRIGKIFFRTILFLSIFYWIISLAGYVSFGDEVVKYDLILRRPALKNSSDIAMKIAISLVTL